MNRSMIDVEVTDACANGDCFLIKKVIVQHFVRNNGDAEKDLSNSKAANKINNAITKSYSESMSNNTKIMLDKVQEEVTKKLDTNDNKKRSLAKFAINENNKEESGWGSKIDQWVDNFKNTKTMEEIKEWTDSDKNAIADNIIGEVVNNISQPIVYALNDVVNNDSVKSVLNVITDVVGGTGLDSTFDGIFKTAIGLPVTGEVVTEFKNNIMTNVSGGILKDTGATIKNALGVNKEETKAIDDRANASLDAGTPYYLGCLYPPNDSVCTISANVVGKAKNKTGVVNLISNMARDKKGENPIVTASAPDNITSTSVSSSCILEGGNGPVFLIGIVGSDSDISAPHFAMNVTIQTKGGASLSNMDIGGGISAVTGIGSNVATVAKEISSVTSKPFEIVEGMAGFSNIMSAVSNGGLGGCIDISNISGITGSVMNFDIMGGVGDIISAASSGDIGSLGNAVGTILNNDNISKISDTIDSALHGDIGGIINIAVSGDAKDAINGILTGKDVTDIISSIGDMLNKNGIKVTDKPTGTPIIGL